MTCWTSHSHWAPAARVSLGGQWAQEAPGHQLHPLKGAEEASGFLWLPAALKGRHPRGCLGQLGSPKAGQGPQRGNWSRGQSALPPWPPAPSGARQFRHLAAVETTEKPVGPRGHPPGGAARSPGARKPEESATSCSSAARARRPHLHWQAVTVWYIPLYMGLTPVL